MDTTNQNIKIANDSDADIVMENLASKALKELSKEDALLYEYFIASPYMADFGDLNSSEHKIFLGSYSNLAPVLKNFLAAGQTASAIYNIGKEYDLGDGKISKIGATIRNLALGNIFIKDLPMVISSSLGIDDTKAGEISNKIISKSFGPIMEDFKRIQRSKFPEKIMQLQKEGRPGGLTQTRPPVQASPAPSPQQSPRTPATEVKPLDSIQKPEFKIPDLGPFDSAQGKQPAVRQSSPQVTKENGNNAQKSLEEELEKVASVIDLRTKPKE